VSTLVLPDPSLVLLIGAAGSGKSTLAARLFPPDEILSSDAMRAAVSGDEADQRASAVAFGILHNTLARRMVQGEMTVVDATNTRAEHRRPLVDRARAASAPIVALVLDLSPAVIHAQNTARTARVVDPTVVDRHIAAIRRTIDGGQLTTEGFDHVVLLHSPTEVADLRIERQGPARPREPAPVSNMRP
jgi:protein phosphatase